MRAKHGAWSRSVNGATDYTSLYPTSVVARLVLKAERTFLCCHLIHIGTDCQVNQSRRFIEAANRMLFSEFSLAKHATEVSIPVAVAFESPVCDYLA